MAVTESTYTGNGSTTNYSFTFPYLKTSDIKTSINGTATTAFTLANATTVQFNTAPANAAAIRIYRETDDSDLQATFYAGSAIKSSDLNDNFNQTLYVTQESNNKIDAAWTTGDETITSSETWVSNDTRVSTTAAQDARIDSKIDTALTTDVAAGNKITVTDNSPGSGQITIGVTSGSLVDSDINASAAIAGTKITPNFGSQNIVTSGTVDGRDVSTDGSKLDGIESGATADQTNAEIRAAVEAASDSNVFTDADHTKLNAIEANATADQTAAEIRTLVESATDSNVFTDADHTKVNNAATLADTQTLTNKTLTSPVINDMSGTAVVTSGTSTSDNKTYSAKRAGEIFYGKDTVGEIQSGETWSSADDKVATTSAIDARIIDLVDDVGGFVPIANETSFPNANPDVNNGAGTLVSIKALSSNLTSNGSGVATIANGTVGNSTVTINGLANSTTYAATFGMIVETTTTLNTYTFHRLVPKATEVTTVSGSISNVNTVAGSISNVNTVAGSISNVNAVAGNNSNVTAVAGNASNINSAVANASNINSAVSNASNINTTAGSISNVNTVAGSISNVNEVADNMGSVNDFAARYRTGSSNPTSSLDTGDLFFNTTANELKVYNGSAWQGGVTATGNFAVVTGNTFTGDNLYNDGIKAKFGTGSDIQIYHSGSHSFMTNDTGTLYFKSDTLSWNSADGENIIWANKNNEVRLYYDNVKKLETTADGVTVNGDLNLQQPSSTTNYIQWDNSEGKLKLKDDIKITVGDGEDLKIYHDGSNSYLDNDTGGVRLNTASDEIQINKGTSEYMGRFITDGAVELYYDNSKKFYTTSTGIYVDGDIDGIPDGSKILVGTHDDMQLYHTSNASYIKASNHKIHIDSGTTDAIRIISGGSTTYGKMADFNTDGSVELYYDGTKKLNTHADGVEILGKLYMADNKNIELGNSQDFKIYHAGGTANKIESGANTLYLAADDLQITNAAISEACLKTFANGAVELYYDGVKKLETHATNGVQFPGGLQTPDTQALRLGNSNDLLIYHNGTDSFIDSDTGKLKIDSAGGVEIYGTYLNVYKAGGSETIAEFAQDGACNLYYDNVKKLNTHAEGILVHGNTTDTRLYFYNSGGSVKGRIETNNSDEIKVITAAGENAILCANNAAVELYYDNVRKFRTTANGAIVDGSFYIADNSHLILNDANKAKFGNGEDLQIYHDGSHSNINNSTGNLRLQTDALRVNSQDNNESIIRADKDGAVELYYDNSKKLETTSTGTLMPEDAQAQFGGTHKLSIYHDATPQAIINNASGLLRIRSHDLRLCNTDNETYFFGTANGAAKLYYDDALKFETNSGGILVSGTLKINDGSSSDNRIALGDSGDLLAFHDGSHSYIRQEGTGWLYLDVQSGKGTYCNTDSTTSTNLTLKKTDSGANGVDYFQCRNSNNGLYFQIEGDGDAKNYNNSWGSTSDSKLKENIVDANSQWEDIKAVKVRNFNFKASTGMPTDKHIGVIAQELETICPNLVKESIDRDPDTDADLGTKTKSVKYSILYMKAIKALQEAMAKIEVLETKVAALESS